MGASGAPKGILGILRATLTQGKANPGKRVQGFLFHHLDQTSLRIASLCNSMHQPINHISTPVSFALSHLEVSFLPLATEKKKEWIQRRHQKGHQRPVWSQNFQAGPPSPIPSHSGLGLELELGVQPGGVPSVPAPQHSLLVMEACALPAPAPISRNTSSR